MHRIILVRHGEPDLAVAEKISGSEISRFLEAYNSAPLVSSSTPSDKLRFLADNATVICSPLPRSLESARRCGVEPAIIDACFAESIPPHFRSRRLKLTPKQWLFFSRILWLGGFSLHGESLYMARKRAKKAAEILLREAAKRDVVLFGHGLFNIMIAARLSALGYRGPRVPARAFWEYGIYRPNQ